VLAAVLVVAVASPARAALPARSLTATDYLGFSDGLQVTLNPSWDVKVGAYRTGHTLTTRVNAALLYTHANAALANWHGPSRQDARARSLVDWLTRAPAFRRNGTHGPGWTSRLDRPGSPEHFSLDPKVAEALAAAYQARSRIGLSPWLLYLAQAFKRLPAVCTRFRSCTGPQQSGGESRLQECRAHLAARARRREQWRPRRRAARERTGSHGSPKLAKS